jgi:hypothetical protein
MYLPSEKRSGGDYALDARGARKRGAAVATNEH